MMVDHGRLRDRMAGRPAREGDKLARGGLVPQHVDRGKLRLLAAGSGVRWGPQVRPAPAWHRLCYLVPPGAKPGRRPARLERLPGHTRQQLPQEGPELSSNPLNDRASVSVRAPATTMDREAVLQRFGGDREALMRAVVTFDEEWPGWLADMRQAIAVGRAKDLERAAYRVAGAARTFSAESTLHAAMEMEQMGRDGTLDGAEQALAGLVDEADALGVQLAQWLASPAPG